MKVIAVNGSPRREGNTFTALKEACTQLEANGIETEIINIGTLGISGCRACGSCSKTGKCVLNDGFNEIAEKLASADGIIIGSPVYYAGINGTVKSFLDRFFYGNAAKMRMKPAAAVVACRRSGITESFQTIYNYFSFAEMLIVPTPYWPGVHGAAAGEAAQDAEGMYIARAVGNNMAYLLRMKAESGIPVPEKEMPAVKFNYIR